MDNQTPSAAPETALTPATAPAPASSPGTSDAAPVTGPSSVTPAASQPFDFSPASIRALVDAVPYEKLKELYEAGDHMRAMVNARWSVGK